MNKCDPSTDTNSFDVDHKAVITKITKMNKTQSLQLDTNLDSKFEFESNLTRNVSLQIDSRYVVWGGKNLQCHNRRNCVYSFMASSFF